MKHILMIAVSAAAGSMAAASDAAAFDARNPADVLAVLSTNGATGELKKGDSGKPYIDAKAGTLGFEVDFYGCNEAGEACSSTLYATGWNLTTVTVDQINAWNRWTMMCPAYLNSAGHPHAWFGVKPSANYARSDVAVQLNTWLDCLSDFDKFTDAPDDFIKAHE
jgi:hypothetical protein